MAGWGLYRQAMAGAMQAQFLGEEQIEGKKALAVNWVVPSGAEGQPGTGNTKLYFDPETHLLIGAHYPQPGPVGPVDTLQMWDDFRPVPSAPSAAEGSPPRRAEGRPTDGAVAGGQGLKFPYHSVLYRDGAKFADFTVQDVKLNTKPDPAIFTKPK